MHSLELLTMLKDDIDKIHNYCSNPDFPDSLIYTDDVYGIMLRNEFREIWPRIEYLKSSLESLSDECSGSNK